MRIGLFCLSLFLLRTFWLRWWHFRAQWPSLNCLEITNTNTQIKGKITTKPLFGFSDNSVIAAQITTTTFPIDCSFSSELSRMKAWRRLINPARIIQMRVKSKNAPTIISGSETNSLRHLYWGFCHTSAPFRLNTSFTVAFTQHALCASVWLMGNSPKGHIRMASQTGRSAIIPLHAVILHFFPWHMNPRENQIFTLHKHRQLYNYKHLWSPKTQAWTAGLKKKKISASNWFCGFIKAGAWSFNI